MSAEILIGCPAWDRAWSLPLWFQSVRENVDPAMTGLVFVVPASDVATRDTIALHSEGFKWVEVLRDKGKQQTREARIDSRHTTLAMARNTILQVVERVQPHHYLSWDSDFLVPPLTVPRLIREHKSLSTVWAWLNRQAPQETEFEGEPVMWQPPVRATAMAWSPRAERRAVHYPGHQFNRRVGRWWRCGVALAFQLMDRSAYRAASYAPHHDGEDVVFNWQLEQRGIERWVCGEILGVHLYDRMAADEISLGWPDVMQLAEQRPLAAQWTGPRPAEHAALGFYPVEGGPRERAPAA